MTAIYLLTVKIDIILVATLSDTDRQPITGKMLYKMGVVHVRRCLQLRLNHITGKILQRWAARKERNELFGTRFFCRHPGACPTIHEERSS